MSALVLFLVLTLEIEIGNGPGPGLDNYKINQNQRCRKVFLSINKKCVVSVCVIVQKVCPHRATERFGFSGLGNGCIFLNQKQFFILSPMEPTSPMALF